VTKARKSLASSAVELVAIIVVAIGLAIGIQAFLVKPYRIPSGSMEPTLSINQRILVDRIGMHFSSPQIGDIMVFHPPADYTSCTDPGEGESVAGTAHGRACDVQQRRESTQTFVKRVVGLPGDRLQIRNGHVYRNGVREKDGYVVACDGNPTCDFPGTIVVPKGDYYMMGDNRPDSEDSRFWGPVPRAWLIGKAFLTYWPLDRIGLL
jgi:signal peptidase I